MRGIEIEARRILEVRRRALIELQHTRIRHPGLHEHGWIVHGHIVLQRVADAREAFFDAHLIRVKPARPAYPRQVVETDDVDAERIAQDTVGGEPMSDYVTLTEGYSGIHRDDGVFYALGPGVPGGQDMPDAHLLDVAPTIQALLGVAPAQDLEGQILFGADARGPASRDVLAATLFPDSGEGGGEAEVNEAQLRALGYVE